MEMYSKLSCLPTFGATMNTDLYSGVIDWDRIYSTFHNPLQIAKRIQEELGWTRNPVVFSGFQETASFLANDLPVTFIDHSPSITNRAREQYPGLQKSCTGDVTQLVASLPAPNIVIACRISAYWDSVEYFEQLANSLLAFPRERILIDFFDRDLVESGQVLTYKSGEDVGDWVFLDIDESKGMEPSCFKAKLKVSYSLCGHSFSYEGHRSFFRKDIVLSWSRAKFPDYDVTIGEALLDSDPSFLLKLVRKKVCKSEQFRTIS